MVKRITLIWMFLPLAALWACAPSLPAAPIRQGGQPPMTVPAEAPSLFGSSSADVSLLNEGFARLVDPGRPADYAGARASFQRLAGSHPGSKWRPLSAAMIRLIDDMQSAQARSQAEKDQLKREIHALSARYQAERAALVQENERLRRDIESLKKLEVQLDQREKMLR